MKKTAIVLAVLTASLFAVSCQKENNPEAIGFTPMTINAVSEGIGTATKTEMIYKYDIAWSANDKIYVTDGTANDTFTLSDGAGTTKGTFTQDGEVTFNNEVQAYYPSTLVQVDGSLVWPATLTNNQTVPMYSTKTLSATEEETFNFSSLGSVFQLIFSTESTGVVLETIELKADEAMSGEFTISNGQAVMPTDGDKPGIKLDLGETGVALGVAAKKFNIAVPAGIYNNLSIILTAKDGRVCEIKAKNAQTIAYNTVSTLTLSKEFKSPVPEGVLPGLFSISATEKVRFAKGNLFCTDNGEEANPRYTFEFEDQQYYYRTRYGKEGEKAVLANGVYNTPQNTSGLFQFVSENAPCATPDILASFGAFSSILDDTIYGEDGDFVDYGSAIGNAWSTLSGEEWMYLLGYDYDNNEFTDNCGRPSATVLSNLCVTVNGVKGVIIAPDDWAVGTYPIDGDNMVYNEETTPKWSELESMGLIFLPYAGSTYAYYDKVYNPGGCACYMSSTGYGSGSTLQLYVNPEIFSEITSASRNGASAVRLIYR